MATRDEIYDEVHDGLTWDAVEGAYCVEPGTPWDDEIDGVYRNDRGTGIWADADAVNDGVAHNLKEAGLS